MTQTPAGFGITLIGDRINPGFKSTRELLECNDLAGIQALAVRQAEAGAASLDVTIGARAQSDPQYLVIVIRAIQEAVPLPLCFDYPDAPTQELCLRTYDQARAGGQLPLVNSITEDRWHLMELYRLRPFRVVVMVSERVENGVARANKTAADFASTAKRAALRLNRDYGIALRDVFIDISVSAVVADTQGMHRATLEAIHALRADAELKGIHLMGGLTNIGQQLPAKAADGSDLKLALENAFLTLAVPAGFDAVLCTPWRPYAPLPDDNYVLQVYREFLEQSGTNALRVVRKLYRRV
ncbi:MAG: dihydropteroate synthase DHPS [Betaproteobacteria bacterium RIFCSPLOWO2_12_FULL_67_28]|nr:MAG: dihydropteroate synthase DHPS [Betaproteobacteria bacterium RIFCSPLOWO2_02_FULL_68_150]OGA62166.1 MAG: dihydropteroate synthase DHPS [Betaproteobacteria bacterium RIFCSPLOWO2_12_FULL_67_28]